MNEVTPDREEFATVTELECDAQAGRAKVSQCRRSTTTRSAAAPVSSVKRALYLERATNNFSSPDCSQGLLIGSSNCPLAPHAGRHTPNKEESATKRQRTAGSPEEIRLSPQTCTSQDRPQVNSRIALRTTYEPSGIVEESSPSNSLLSRSDFNQGFVTGPTSEGRFKSLSTFMEQYPTKDDIDMSSTESSDCSGDDIPLGLSSIKMKKSSEADAGWLALARRETTGFDAPTHSKLSL